MTPIGFAGVDANNVTRMLTDYLDDMPWFTSSFVEGRRWFSHDDATAARLHPLRMVHPLRMEEE